MIILQVSPTTTIGWRIDPGTTLPPTAGKPLNFYANLSVNIDTTELTQEELRKLIYSLTLVLSGHKDTTPQWRFAWKPISWIDQHWQVLLEDPAGVIKWAADSLANNGQGGTT